MFVLKCVDSCAIFLLELLVSSCAQFVLARPTRAVSMVTPKGGAAAGGRRGADGAQAGRSL